MRQTAEAPPLGGFLTVGDRRLWLHRSGDGGPAVVLLPGAGTAGLDYLNIFQLTAPLTTSVLYDRAGTGWSQRVRMPRTGAEVTDELLALLNAAGVAPPYLLVGHSLGGLYARHYAQRFPDEVAGLVLLDPAHEDYAAHMPEAQNGDSGAPKPGVASLMASGALIRTLAAIARNGLTGSLLVRLPVIRRYRELYRRLFTEEMADWPGTLRDALVEHHVSLDWLVIGMEEAQRLETLYAEVRRAGPMPDVRLIVFCSTAVDEFRRAVAPGEPEDRVRAALAGQRRLYETLAASVPRGEVRPLDAGHLTMSFRHPGAVLEAVREILGR